LDVTLPAVERDVFDTMEPGTLMACGELVIVDNSVEWGKPSDLRAIPEQVASTDVTGRGNCCVRHDRTWDVDGVRKLGIREPCQLRGVAEQVTRKDVAIHGEIFPVMLVRELVAT
jgi:hypothetical protein